MGDTVALPLFSRACNALQLTHRNPLRKLFSMQSLWWPRHLQTTDQHQDTPTTILLLFLPREGKTKGLGEVTGIAGERERKSEKGRRGGRKGMGDGKVREHMKGGRIKR